MLISLSSDFLSIFYLTFELLSFVIGLTELASFLPFCLAQSVRVKLWVRISFLDTHRKERTLYKNVAYGKF